MQAVVSSYVWDWKELRALLATLAPVCVPDDPDDLIGPGLAIDETAQPKGGNATAGVSPQHAGCAGRVINCVTTVFAAYVTARGHSWVDVEHYLPRRWAVDLPRRRQAHVPDDVDFAAKTDLAITMVRRLVAAGLRVGWVAFDEVYGTAEKLRVAVAELGLSYVGIVACTHPIPLPSGTVIEAQDAVALAVFERRSAGNGSRGPRDSDWALLATAITGQYLLIRRLTSRDTNNLAFYLCWAPPGTAATIRYFLAIAARRWPIEETFKLAKDVLGWDLTQVRNLVALNRHTALTALAQLGTIALRATINGDVTLPALDLPALDQPSPAQPSRPHRARTRRRRPRRPAGSPRRRRHPDHRRSALPHRPRPDQALPRRDTPRQRPRRTPPRRTDHQERPRVRAPLVAAAQTPPGGGTVARLQPPPHRDHCQRPTNGDPERKSHDVTTPGTRHITLRGSAMTHRKTATVVQGDNSRPRCRAQQRIAVSARAPLMRFVSEHPPCSAQPRTGAHDGTRARALWQLWESAGSLRISTSSRCRLPAVVIWRLLSPGLGDRHDDGPNIHTSLPG